MLWLFQIVILVVDSTDRERLTLTKEELHQMLSHEVRTPVSLYIRSDDSRADWFLSECSLDVKTLLLSGEAASSSYLDDTLLFSEALIAA